MNDSMDDFVGFNHNLPSIGRMSPVGDFDSKVLVPVDWVE